jgi:hypothetical protein
MAEQVERALDPVHPQGIRGLRRGIGDSAIQMAQTDVRSATGGRTEAARDHEDAGRPRHRAAAVSLSRCDATSSLVVAVWRLNLLLPSPPPLGGSGLKRIDIVHGAAGERLPEGCQELWKLGANAGRSRSGMVSVNTNTVSPIK